MNKVISAVCFLAVIILADAATSTAHPGSTGAHNTSSTAGPPTTHSAAQSTGTASTATTAPTTAATPVTTGAQPNTTTSVPTTPTPSSRNYTARQFSVSGNNKTCILVHLAANFTLTYETAPNVTNQTLIRLDTSKDATGTCGDNKQSIIWQMVNPNVTMTWHYVKRGNNYGVNYTVITINMAEIKGSTIKETVTFTNTSNGLVYSAAVGNSYLCNSEGPRNLNSSGKARVRLQTQALQSQAFRNVKTTAFSSAQQCQSDLKTSNLVPIAVGAALAGLVIIVLIAYLIGRRKNKRGYESV